MIKQFVLLALVLWALKQDGVKNLNLRFLTSRAKKTLPEIRKDLELLDKLPQTYQKD